MQDDAKDRDHKKLGRELGLFTFSDTVGKGLPLWTEKGAAMRRVLERFIVDEEIRRGYNHVMTPDIAKLDLYKKSGHYPHYKKDMYAPIVIDDEEFMLRPMTCPHHFELYLDRPRSYRELPIRYAEIAKLYRYEQSGELMGLQRVRSFSLSDAHIICADEKQAISEIERALDLIEYANKVFGLEYGKDYWYRLSLGDRENTEKYFKNDEGWEKAEKLMREFLQKRGADFVEGKGEAAFYGPKIDVQMKNVNGKEDTAFTVQYDFCMPGRFNLKYIAEDGKEREPIVVHRSSIGAVERTIAFLIEHYAGKFPTWLSPVQVRVLSLTDAQADYSKKVHEALMNAGVRSELDLASESLGKKIRDAKVAHIPYFLVIGKQEEADGKVMVESRDNGKIGAIPLDELISKIKTAVDSHK